MVPATRRPTDAEEFAHALGLVGELRGSSRRSRSSWWRNVSAFWDSTTGTRRAARGRRRLRRSSGSPLPFWTSTRTAPASAEQLANELVGRRLIQHRALAARAGATGAISTAAPAARPSTSATSAPRRPSDSPVAAPVARRCRRLPATPRAPRPTGSARLAGLRRARTPRPGPSTAGLPRVEHGCPSIVPARRAPPSTRRASTTAAESASTSVTAEAIDPSRRSRSTPRSRMLAGCSAATPSAVVSPCPGATTVTPARKHERGRRAFAAAPTTATSRSGCPRPRA